MSNKFTLPSFPVSGGCQCENVRYWLNASPIVFYICHCASCQKQSSSAFGQSLRVKSADLEVLGKLQSVENIANSGQVMKYQFCPNCGTRLFHSRNSYHKTLNIKAGSLDDTSWLVPAGHIWTRSKQNWFEIPHGALAYEQQPENFDALIEKWQEMI